MSTLRENKTTLAIREELVSFRKSIETQFKDFREEIVEKLDNGLSKIRSLEGENKNLKETINRLEDKNR